MSRRYGNEGTWTAAGVSVWFLLVVAFMWWVRP